MKKILQSDNNSALIATQYLKEGKVIAFACDTVYGLAADASNYKALEKLYHLKKRDQNKPLAVFFKDLNQAEKYLYFDKISKKIAQNFLPGSLTLVLKKLIDIESPFAKNLNQKNDFLGFRIVKNDFVKKILDNFSGILAVTSANISGQKAATDAREVENEFALLDLDLLVDCGLCEEKIPSTILQVDNEKITILREGLLLDKIKNFLANEKHI